MTPFAKLIFGAWAFILLVTLGWIYDWHFLAGIGVMAVGSVALGGWLYWFAFGEVR